MSISETARRAGGGWREPPKGGATRRCWAGLGAPQAYLFSIYGCALRAEGTGQKETQVLILETSCSSGAGVRKQTSQGRYEVISAQINAAKERRLCGLSVAGPPPTATALSGHRGPASGKAGDCPLARAFFPSEDGPHSCFLELLEATLASVTDTLQLFLLRPGLFPHPVLC